MKVFRRAIAMANIEKKICPDTSVYNHSLIFELQIADNKVASPDNSLKKLLAEMEHNDTNVIFLTIDDKRISVNDIPHEKHTFDTWFQTNTRKTRTDKLFLQMFFKIKSKRPWSIIKNEMWNFLKNEHLFIRRSPGPATKTLMIGLGIITNIPKLASLPCVLNDIDNAFIEETENKLKIYLARSKVNGNLKDETIVDPYSVIAYSDKENVEHNLDILENGMGKLPFNMKFIPFHLKDSDPDIFGRFLYSSLKNVSNMRNIALAGISPDFMDYGSYPTSPLGKIPENDSLFDRISNLDGVIRIDSHRRTIDLGKWHVSVKMEKYNNICNDIDDIIEEVKNNYPACILNSRTKYAPFPDPVRLSNVSGYSTRSRSSNLTTSSKYKSWLTKEAASDAPIPSMIDIPQTAPTKPNVGSISYAQAVNNSIASPTNTSESNINKTKPGSHSNCVSEITDNITITSIQEMIDNALAKQKEEQNKKLMQLTERVDNLIQGMQKFQETAINDLVENLYTKSDFVTKSDFQDLKYDLLEAVKALVIAEKPQSPARKKPNTGGMTTMEEDVYDENQSTETSLSHSITKPNKIDNTIVTPNGRIQWFQKMDKKHNPASAPNIRAFNQEE